MLINSFCTKITDVDTVIDNCARLTEFERVVYLEMLCQEVLLGNAFSNNFQKCILQLIQNGRFGVAVFFQTFYVKSSSVQYFDRMVVIFFPPVTMNEGEPPFKRSLAERLGQKKMIPKDMTEEVPLKGI